MCGGIPRDRLHDDTHSYLALLPPGDLNALSFQILVRGEEILDLFQHVARNVRDVEEFIRIRIVKRNG